MKKKLPGVYPGKVKKIVATTNKYFILKNKKKNIPKKTQFQSKITSPANIQKIYIKKLMKS